MKTIVTNSLVALSVTAILSCGCAVHRGVVNLATVRKDSKGDKPRDIAEAFIAAVHASDLETARKYWDHASLQAIRINYGSFKDFCAQFAGMKDCHFPVATPGKKGVKWLKMTARAAGTNSEDGYTFYLELIDGRWRLVQSVWQKSE